VVQAHHLCPAGTNGINRLPFVLDYMDAGDRMLTLGALDEAWSSCREARDGFHADWMPSFPDGMTLNTISKS
jgi:hypothetical protein